MARYIILPPRGVRADTASAADALVNAIGTNRSTMPPLAKIFGDLMIAVAPGAATWALDLGFPDAAIAGRAPEDVSGTLSVIDSIHEDGAKLVEMDADAVDRFLRTATEARLVPVTEYDYNMAPAISPIGPPPGAQGMMSVRIECAETGVPVGGVHVTLLTDAAQRIGASGVSGSDGRVMLPLGVGPVHADLLLAEPPAVGHWGLFAHDRSVAHDDVLRLPMIATTHDPIAPHRATAQTAALRGAGVRIAIIDSGIGPHPDLRVAALENTVPGEPIGDGADNGVGHGTHLAGAIAGQGPLFTGIAPAAELHSFRVGAADGALPINYSIVKAMDHAANQCDIINLSLSTAADDSVLRDAIRDVNLRGCIVVAAAGNGWRDALAEPARFPEVLAVTAYGDSAAFPPGSDAARHIANPVNPLLPSEFVAGFSNIAGASDGVALIAPGVGVVSTAIGGAYRVMHGTSMATAIASALIAILLSRNPQILAMPRDHARSVAIRKLALSAAKRRGFGLRFEGFGAL